MVIFMFKLLTGLQCSNTQTNDPLSNLFLFEKLMWKFNRILSNVSISYHVKSSENQTLSDGFYRQHMGILARNTAQKMKFSIKDFFSKCNQIRSKLHFLCSGIK